MSDEISNYLLSKKTSPDIEAIEQRKQRWLRGIEGLYANIDNWLRESIVTNVVDSPKRGEIHIVEERTGGYRAPTYLLSIGAVRITFEPKATYVVGADGRVDVSSTTGRKANLLIKGNQWLFVDPRTHEHPELSKSTFLALLQYLLDR